MTFNAFDTQQSDDPLPLIDLELINWENNGHNEIYTFPNDHATTLYLNAVEPKTNSTNEFANSSSSRGGVKSLSHKSKNRKTNITSNVETHLMTILDQVKVKRKDVFYGENLLEVPKDGIFDTLPKYYQERSLILIEPTKAINIGTLDNPKILHPTRSLLEQEKWSYIEFFKKRQINFVW